MRLEQAEPIKSELPGLFREPRQLVHTRRVRQIACKVLRQIICKVTSVPELASRCYNITSFMLQEGSALRGEKRACNFARYLA